MDAVPLLSQVKSLIQLIAGDEDGARQTQQNFSKRCLIVSQIRSLIEAASGDEKAALQTQLEFLKGVEGVIDGTPGVGHIKGVVHYALGQKQKGDHCMKRATRTAGVIGGGIAGGLLGPAGAVLGAIEAGALVDIATTKIDSAVHGEYRPAGIQAMMDNVIKDPSAGNIIDLVGQIGFDGIAGYNASRAYQKLFKEKRLYRVAPEQQVERGLRQQRLPAADNQKGVLGETCFSESIQHQKEYLNQKRSVFPDRKFGDMQITVDREWYNEMKENDLIEQRGSKQINCLRVGEGKRPFNVFTKEKLEGTRHINVNLKGQENLNVFNDHVVGIKEVNPHDIWNSNAFIREVKHYGKEVVGMEMAINSEKRKVQAQPQKIGDCREGVKSLGQEYDKIGKKQNGGGQLRDRQGNANGGAMAKRQEKVKQFEEIMQESAKDNNRMKGNSSWGRLRIGLILLGILLLIVLLRYALLAVGQF